MQNEIRKLVTEKNQLPKINGQKQLTKAVYFPCQ